MDPEALRAERDTLRSQRNYWERRYEEQHDTVHRLEDEIARYRAALGKLQRSAEVALNDRESAKALWADAVRDACAGALGNAE